MVDLPCVSFAQSVVFCVRDSRLDAHSVITKEYDESDKPEIVSAESGYRVAAWHGFLKETLIASGFPRGTGRRRQNE